MDRTITPTTLADATDVAAATVNYPDDDGIELLDAQLVWPIAITAEDCTVAVQVSVDRVAWHDATIYAEDLATGWLGGPVTFPAGAPIDALWQVWWVRAEYVRISAAFPNATNRLRAVVGRRKP